MRQRNYGVVLGIALSFLGSALSQPPGDEPRPRFPVSLAGFVAVNPQLQQELKLDKDQVARLKEALEKVREDMHDELVKARDASPEEQHKVREKMRVANDHALSSVLKPEQVKRLLQVENQMMGIALFDREDVRKDLDLSDDQKDKIKHLREDEQKGMREARTSGGGLAALPKMEEIRKEAMDKVEKVLDKTQRGKLKEFLGEPFRFVSQGLPSRPRPGQILPPDLQDRLKLTAEQKKQVEELQKEVDAKLEKLLDENQRQQLKEIRQGARGGFGRGPVQRPGEDK